MSGACEEWVKSLAPWGVRIVQSVFNLEMVGESGRALKSPPRKTGWTVLTPHGASDFTHSSQAPNKCIDYILLWNGNGAKCDVVGTKIMLDFNKGDIKRASDHIPVLVDVKF